MFGKFRTGTRHYAIDKLLDTAMYFMKRLCILNKLQTKVSFTVCSPVQLVYYSVVV